MNFIKLPFYAINHVAKKRTGFNEDMQAVFFGEFNDEFLFSAFRRASPSQFPDFLVQPTIPRNYPPDYLLREQFTSIYPVIIPIVGFGDHGKTSRFTCLNLAQSLSIISQSPRPTYPTSIATQLSCLLSLVTFAVRCLRRASGPSPQAL